MDVSVNGSPSQSDTENNNKLIRCCSAIIFALFPRHDDKLLHPTVSEWETNWKARASEKRVYNYALAWQNKISNLQGTAEQTVQEITRREAD